MLYVPKRRSKETEVSNKRIGGVVSLRLQGEYSYSVRHHHYLAHTVKDSTILVVRFLIRRSSSL